MRIEFKDRSKGEEPELPFPELNTTARRLLEGLNGALVRSPEYAHSRVRAYIVLALANPTAATLLRAAQEQQLDSQRRNHVLFESGDYTYSGVYLGTTVAFGLRVTSFLKPGSMNPVSQEDIFVRTAIDDYATDEVVVQYRASKTNPIHAKSTPTAVTCIEAFIENF